MPENEAKQRARRKYEQTTRGKMYKQIKLALHIEHDADVIEALEKQPNVRQYIIGLIRQDQKQK